MRKKKRRGHWYDVIPKLPALPLAQWLRLNSSFYVYQSSHLISHGHCATELVVSDCTRAELSSWIFLCTRERDHARISSATGRGESSCWRYVNANNVTMVDHRIARNYPYIFCKKDNISLMFSLMASLCDSLNYILNFPQDFIVR